MNDYSPDPRMHPQRTRPPGDEGPVELLRQLTQQGAHLAQEQVHLMQAEVRETAADLKQVIAAMLGAAVVGIAGLGVFLMALSYLLGDAIDDVGLATLIVGIATLALAAFLASSGRKKMQETNLKPERTLRTVRDDPAAATGNMPRTGVNHGY